MSAKLGRSYLCAQLPFTKEKYTCSSNVRLRSEASLSKCCGS